MNGHIIKHRMLSLQQVVIPQCNRAAATLWKKINWYEKDNGVSQKELAALSHPVINNKMVCQPSITLHPDDAQDTLRRAFAKRDLVDSPVLTKRLLRQYSHWNNGSNSTSKQIDHVLAHLETQEIKDFFGY